MMQCHFCSKDTTEDDFCNGCGKHVCDECSVNWDVPWGVHDVNVHKEEPED